MGIFSEAAGKADMGKTILYALLVGLPTVVVLDSHGTEKARFNEFVSAEKMAAAIKSIN